MRSASVKKRHLGATATRDRARQRNANGIEGADNEIYFPEAPREDPGSRKDEPEHNEKGNRAITTHDGATLPIQESRAQLSLYVYT